MVSQGRTAGVPEGSSRPRLSDLARNVHSQDGEDGILEAVFSRIGATSRTCVEFGAWDGLHLSNTAVFWQSGWRAVLIEADADRYKAMVSNTAGHDCLCLQHHVTPSGPGSLEAVLTRHGRTEDPDLLVIDVDGDDYHIFAGLEGVRPRVVCCEYNPTIPAHAMLIGRQGDGFGCSARALVALAEDRGYVLVAMTSVNCIFVRREHASEFAGFETRLDALFPSSHLISLVTSYDGRYLLSARPPYGMTRPHRGGLLVGEAFEVEQTPLERLANRLALLWRRGRVSLAWRVFGIRRAGR